MNLTSLAHLQQVGLARAGKEEVGQSLGTNDYRADCAIGRQEDSWADIQLTGEIQFERLFG